MMSDDNEGQMIFRDLGGLKLPDICPTGEEKPRKTSPRKLVPTGDRTRACCITGMHATTWSTKIIGSHLRLELYSFDYVVELKLNSYNASMKQKYICFLKTILGSRSIVQFNHTIILLTTQILVQLSNM